MNADFLLQVFVVMSGIWATGYCAGLTTKWVRRLRDAA